MATTDALVLLRAMGLDPTSHEAQRAVARVEHLRFAWHNNSPYFEGETEACINGDESSALGSAWLCVRTRDRESESLEYAARDARACMAHAA